MPHGRWLEQARAALHALGVDRHDAAARGSLGEAWTELGEQERPDWLLEGRAELLLPQLPGWPVHTERLTLRAPTLADAEPLHRMFGDPEVVRYLPFGELSRQECAARIARLGTPMQTEDLFAARPMVEFNGQLIGELTLRIPGPAFSAAEVGWVFDPVVEGQGFATEAAAALVRLALEDLGMHRVYATLDPRNTRSAALCARLGMTQETLARRDYWSKGEWSDSATWALLR